MHAVISDTRLFAEYGDIELSGVRFIGKLFGKAVADHTVTDDC